MCGLLPALGALLTARCAAGRSELPFTPSTTRKEADPSALGLTCVCDGGGLSGRRRGRPVRPGSESKATARQPEQKSWPAWSGRNAPPRCLDATCAR